MDVLAGSTELTVLGWSGVLLVVNVFMQMVAYIRDVGLAYAMSNRDGSKVAGPLTMRLQRGIANYVETYGAFIALALALILSGKSGGLGATGALVWFWARIVYIPVFAAGIAVLRTGVWTVSMIGLVLMIVRLLS